MCPPLFPADECEKSSEEVGPAAFSPRRTKTRREERRTKETHNSSIFSSLLWLSLPTSEEPFCSGETGRQFPTPVNAIIFFLSPNNPGSAISIMPPVIGSSFPCSLQYPIKHNSDKTLQPRFHYHLTLDWLSVSSNSGQTRNLLSELR